MWKKKDLMFTKNLSNARDKDTNLTKFGINYKSFISDWADS